MSQLSNPYASFGGGEAAAFSPATERADFIKRTYIHLAAAVYAFAAIEFAMFKLGIAQELVEKLFGMGRMAGFVLIGAFMLVSWVADSWARSNNSRGMQYAGLMLYVAAEALIFLPLLYVCQKIEAGNQVSIIGPAAVITLVIFGGLTAAVFLTGADFSFLRTGLMLAGLGAMGFVLCSALFGFNLGTIFTVAMIVFAGAYILYDTSNVLHHYRTDQYVAASLALFASVALLFYYILMLVARSRD